MQIGTGFENVSYFFASSSIDGLNVNSSFNVRRGDLINIFNNLSFYELRSLIRVNCEVSIKNVKRRCK